MDSSAGSAGMYEAVHAYPDGDATVARYARTASRYGLSGVVVRSREAEFDPGTVGEAYDVDVIPGIEIRASNPQEASGAIGNFRPDYPVLVVGGGTDALNRFAVEQDRVDVLARPMHGDGDFNHVLARAAREHDVRVEFDLGPVLRSAGGPRVQALRDLRKLRELVDKYDTSYVVTATPESHLHLRAPRELVAVGEEIGFDAGAVREGLREWGRIAERNRHRLSGSFVSPGVERGRYDEE